MEKELQEIDKGISEIEAVLGENARAQWLPFLLGEERASGELRGWRLGCFQVGGRWRLTVFKEYKYIIDSSSLILLAKAPLAIKKEAVDKSEEIKDVIVKRYRLG